MPRVVDETTPAREDARMHRQSGCSVVQSVVPAANANDAKRNGLTTTTTTATTMMQAGSLGSGS
jgi:hypothetical protein